MTNEKALEMMNATCEILQIPCDCDKEQGCVTQMAKKALEKQIPKRPIIYFGLNACPSCTTEISRRVIMKWMHYCPDCGQAIDWSEVNGNE